MAELIVPAINLDEAPFSDKLRSYLAKVSEETGRCLFFSDLGELRKSDPSVLLAKAQVRSEPDKPYIAILVNMGEVSRSKYQPEIHDPLMAHEATHVVYHLRGFLPLSVLQKPPEIYWAIDAVSNWLSDPLINQEIRSLGFDMTPDRETEIKESTTGLNRGMWQRRPFRQTARIAVSFLLEPNISPYLQAKFRTALQNGLSKAHHASILKLAETIKQGGFDTPDKYANTTVACAQQLERVSKINLKPYDFVALYKRFTRDEQVAWIEANIKVWGNWL